MVSHPNLTWTDYRRYQRDFVRENLNAPLRKGDEWFLVDMAWFRRWKDFVGYDIGDAEHARKQSPNPGRIDLSPLLAPDGVTLITGLMPFEHYVLVPLTVWAQFLQWYGLCEGQPVLRRLVAEFGLSKKVEVYPLEFQLRCLRDGRSVTCSFSRNDTLFHVKQVMRGVFGIPAGIACRVWRERKVLKNENAELRELGLFSGTTLFIEYSQPDGTWRVY